MNTLTYSITASPLATGRTISKSESLTGTTDVTFSFDNLSAYDAPPSVKKMTKVVVDFDDGEELVFNRPLSGTTILSLTGNTFKHVLQTDVIDRANRHVYLTVYREDLEVDVVDLKFTMHKPPVTVYENINLLKTDYFNNDVDNEKLLLTFINKNPEVLGMSLLDVNIPGEAGYDPALTGSQAISANSFNVGFTTEYVQTYAADSNTGSAIQVSLLDTIDSITGLPKNHGSITLKYRTRAPGANPSNAGTISLPSNPEIFYIPLTANSSFFHLSGFLSWNCGDILKDIDLSTKTITIPLVDIVGVRTLRPLADYYFSNIGVGCGTEPMQTAGGYFYVDLYDVAGCDSLTTTTSTITAFVNYS